MGWQSTVDASQQASLTAAEIALLGLPVQTAAAIATGNPAGTPGGVPLLHGVTNLLNTSIALAHNAVVATPITTLTRPGYFARFTLSSAGAMTVPFVIAELIWIDSASNHSVAHESWVLPVGTGGAGNVFVFAKGPTKADHVTLQLTNLDPAVSCSVGVVFNQTTHHINRDDWRQDTVFTSGPVNGFTLSTGDSTENYIFLDANPFAANQTLQFLLPLYAGQVDISVSVTTGVGTAKCQLIPYDVINGGFFNAAFNMSATNTAPFNSQNLALGRSPHLLSINASAAITVTTCITALEFVS